MNIRLIARRSLQFSPAVLLAVLALSGSVAAATPNEIVGVWSFSGGAVGVQMLPNGTYQGTVVSPTTFAKCEHPVGQVMWTDMRAQPDGSLWGHHQWFHGTKCEEDPVLGLTAWRVLKTPAGTRILEVCFNIPGGDSQPTIAPNGESANVTYGCEGLNPLAPLPVTSSEGSGSGTQGGSGQIGFAASVVLPGAKTCVRQSSLKVVLRNPKYDPLKEVVIRIEGKKVLDLRGVKRLKQGILLAKLPNGTYKVGVLAITVLNQRLSGTSTYHSCTKVSGKIKLHRTKPRHHR